MTIFNRVAMHLRQQQGPVRPLLEKYRFWRAATPEKYGGSYFKNMVAEAPELLVCFAYIGTACYFFYGHYQADAKHGYLSSRPYKTYYTVMRPDDERVQKIRTEFYDRTAENDPIDSSVFMPKH